LCEVFLPEGRLGYARITRIATACPDLVPAEVAARAFIQVSSFDDACLGEHPKAASCDHLKSGQS
jgi:hypothetical protein